MRNPDLCRYLVPLFIDPQVQKEVIIKLGLHLQYVASKTICFTFSTERGGKFCKSSAYHCQWVLVIMGAEPDKEFRNILQPPMEKPWASTYSEPQVTYLRNTKSESCGRTPWSVCSSFGFARTLRALGCFKGENPDQLFSEF